MGSELPPLDLGRTGQLRRAQAYVETSAGCRMQSAIGTSSHIAPVVLEGKMGHRLLLAPFGPQATGLHDRRRLALPR